MTADDWPCDAYGPDGREFGALCFVADAGERVCGSLEECRQVVTAERQRVFRLIQEQAAAGDPVAAYLLSEFTVAEQLLGGGDRSEEGGQDG